MISNQIIFYLPPRTTVIIVNHFFPFGKVLKNNWNHHNYWKRFVHHLFIHLFNDNDGKSVTPKGATTMGQD